MLFLPMLQGQINFTTLINSLMEAGGISVTSQYAILLPLTLSVCQKKWFFHIK